MSWFHVFILFSVCWPHVKSKSACNISGWFGTDCKYKCHCENGTCNSNGHCLSESKCSKEWFGKMCQYKDLMTIPSVKIVTEPKQSTEWLVDRDDLTCNNQDNLKRISITWNSSYWITWLQINVKTNSSNLAKSLKINPCKNMKNNLINKSTLIIKCDPKIALRNLNIQGQMVKSICSLYISGGMNISWKEAPNKLLTYEPSTYNNSVDGNRNEIFSTKSSMYIDEDSSNFSKCTLVFDKAMTVNRFLIYNIDDCCADKLHNITIQTFDANDKQVFTFNFTHYKTIEQVTNVLVPVDEVNKAINKLKISSNTSFKELSLCKLEAYGECDRRNYGEECKNKCPENCNDEGCNNVNGNCFSCIPGYQGKICRKECSPNFYGQNCINKCSSSCLNQICDPINGSCYNCSIGRQGDQCDFCETGSFGEGCLHNCSVNCLAASCYPENGTCQSGCKDGFEGEMCNIPCSPGTYGVDCFNNCSRTCSNQSCNHIDGHCLGCEPGYHGQMCEKACSPGTYGMDCFNNCSRTCKNQSCNHIDGHCLGCKPGYYGKLCDEACSNGTYGVDCLDNCSRTCTNQSCNHISGHCQSCEPGYRGKMCDEECEHNKHGMNCTLECSDRCRDKRCSAVEGYCLSCFPGFRGVLCEQECKANFYGQNCTYECNTSCLNQICDPINGSCYNCSIGRQGDQCDFCETGSFGEGCSHNCSVNCVAGSCYPENGTCYYGCKDGFKGEMCNTAIVSSTSMMSDIALGSIISIVAIAALIIAGFLLRRFQSHTSRRIKTDEQGLVDISTRGWEKKPVSCITNNNEPRRLQDTSMSIMEFNNFMSSQNMEYFEAQFKSIPVPQNVSMEVAQSVQNKNKNRYKNICPYDHSRVRLLTNGDQNEADYINASYIKGHNDEFRFIASQGPTKSTLNDFVLMVWEQNVDNVVMLTNVIEEGKVKCDQYWPDTGDAQFGEITVKLKSIKTFADYIIRSFEMFGKDKEMIKTFTQFHFTSWPDKGVPFSPWSLVEFLKRISAQPAKSLVVVHCSAGVGRTGTFIGLDNVIRQAQETGRVDFFKTVSKMRKDRILMIQTAEQYLFLHKAAQAAIVCINTNVTPRNISDVMRKLEDKSINCKTKLEEEFKGLCTACGSFVNDTRDTLRELDNDGNVYENIVNVNLNLKNRYPSIIPKQHFRPYLSNESEDMGDYINAVFVPGFYKKDSQFLTQLPLPTTVVDFWRLVSQYGVSLIVAFEIDSMENDTTFGNYLPVGEDKSLSCPPYQIISTAKKEEVLWEESRLDVNKGAESRSVIHIKCLFTDLSPKNLLSLVKHVRSYDREVQGTKLYTCRNGAYFSGLICVLLELLDRIENDGYVSVPILVGGIKSIRMEVIPTLEQYRVIYDMLVSSFQST